MTIDPRARRELAIVKISAQTAMGRDFNPNVLNSAFAEWWDAQYEINGSIPAVHEFITVMSNAQLTARVIYEMCRRIAEHVVEKEREP